MTRQLHNRLPAIDRWWRQLNDRDQDRARLLATTGELLPVDLFFDLCDAGVLAVEDTHRARVKSGFGSFPMPGDIRAYVQNTAPHQTPRSDQENPDQSRAALAGAAAVSSSLVWCRRQDRVAFRPRPRKSDRAIAETCPDLSGAVLSALV